MVFIFVYLFILEKYDYVGRLLRPGESHGYYTDEEETPTNKLHLENPKQFENNKSKDKFSYNDNNEPLKTDADKEILDNSSGQSLDSGTEQSDVTKSSNGSATQDIKK